MNTKERNIKKAQAICDLYATGKYTIEGCCESEGVPFRTFYCWIREASAGYIACIAELYKKACEDKDASRKKAIQERKATIGEKALAALEKKLDGYTWTETVKEDGKVVKTVGKSQAPDAASIIFSLVNAFPDDFKNRQDTDITTRGKPIYDKVEFRIIRQKNVDNGNT
jgi:hypothetical protein